MSHTLIIRTVLSLLCISSLSYGFDWPEIHFPLFVGPQFTNSSYASSDEDHDYTYGPTYIYNTVSPIPYYIPWHYGSNDNHPVDFERPATILGNVATAALGTICASTGTLIGTYGFCALIQALFLKSHYKNYLPQEVFLGRLQDGTIGLSITSVGLLLTLFGAQEIKESIKRIYYVYTGKRLAKKATL